MTAQEKARAKELSELMITLSDNIDKWSVEKGGLEAQIQQADGQLEDARRKFDALLFGDDED